ncbi:hypothetical protein GN956_G25768 [Arapaima gigas]
MSTSAKAFRVTAPQRHNAVVFTACLHPVLFWDLILRSSALVFVTAAAHGSIADLIQQPAPCDVPSCQEHG